MTALRVLQVVFISFLSLPVSLCRAGTITTFEEHGMAVYELVQGNTKAKVAPAAGANVYSIEVDGIEYLHPPESTEKPSGTGYGVPVLYPTPNRVKDAAFTFEGTQVQFMPNSGKNFIHGLVNRYAWRLITVKASDSFASIVCEADFSAGSELHTHFPFAHRLTLAIEVRERVVRWTYTVDNREGEKPVPFGFALHPYFVYQGSRENTYLTIPATHWMESTNQLPSGKLVPPQDLAFALGEPISLNDTQFDDVFWGLTADKPTRIEFRDVHRGVAIQASEAFTHLVVWTPQRPFFGIESQTCSTDAHNLHHLGKIKEAHLQICRPGETMSGWVEYQFQDAQ